MKRCFRILLASLLAVAQLAFAQVYTNPNLTGVDTGASVIGMPVIGGTVNQVLYIDASGNLAGSAGLTWTGTALATTGTVTIPAGLVGTPTLRLGSDTATGLYQTAANELAWSISGTQRWLLTSTGSRTTGGVALNAAVGANVALTVSSPGTASGGTQTAVNASYSGTTSGTSAIQGYNASLTAPDGGGITYATLVGFRANAIAKSGAGDTITEYAGFRADANTAAALNIGFKSSLAVSGSARYNIYADGTAPNYLQGALILGTTAANITASQGSIGMAKITASASAPGAAGAKFEVVCGTNAGTAKLVMYAGTSGTAVTVTDNVGTGVTGC